MSLLILLLSLLFSCQLNFYFQNLQDEESITDVPDLDRDLIIRLSQLRKAHLDGELSESDGLREAGSVKYVVQIEGNKLYISFFGTESAEDLYYGLVYWQEPFWTSIDSEIRIHAGFNRPFQAVSESIQSKVEDFLAGAPVDPQIFIQGHSGGGVHGIYCAFSLIQVFTVSQIEEIYCVTAGALAPGNNVFAELLNSEERIVLHRYINGSDMVPSILSEEMGYFHVGQPYRIGPDPDPITSSTGLWMDHHFVESYADSVR